MSQSFEVVIGLEVHAELSTRTKIFCSCPTTFGAEPNTQTCPVCLGLPGSLPVLNQRALLLALRAALALESSVQPRTKFDRKNYFYPDLPKAYQISQYDLPLARQGRLNISTPSGEKIIGITRVHMEEDAGKLLHQSIGGQIGSAGSSGVDYNRAGIPLIEIVSEPDLRSAEEAYAYLTGLKEILEYSEVSDCNMEQGRLRCDANISVRPAGQQALGTKVELKNMNSFKNVRAAMEYEAKRQIKAISEGNQITQETRLWDADKEVTYAMRSKEEAHDYRYFPEPDLPLVEISPEMIETTRQEIPELPAKRRERFIQAYGLNEYDAGVLVASKAMAEYFEQTVRTAPQAKPKALCNWITGELLGKLNAEGRAIVDSPISAVQLADLVSRVESDQISGKMAKQVFVEMYATGQDAAAIIAAKGLSQISDQTALNQIVDQVLAAHPGPISEFKAGKLQALGFLVGQVMKASQGQANPKMVNEILKQKLGK